MLCFPRQCLTTLGRQLLLSKGTSASLSLVTRVTLVEGTHGQYPLHQEFCVFLGCWVTGCITHIHSWQFTDEVGKSGPSLMASQGHQLRVRLVTEPLVPPKERAAGVRFYQVRQLWAVYSAEQTA